MYLLKDHFQICESNIEKDEVLGTWHYQLLTLLKRKPALYKVDIK